MLSIDVAKINIFLMVFVPKKEKYSDLCKSFPSLTFMGGGTYCIDMKHFKALRVLIFSLLLMLLPLSSFAQDMRDTLVFYFAKSKAVLDFDYMDNGARSKDFLDRLKGMQAAEGTILIKVEVVGTASPEGDTLFNHILSESRQKAVVRYLRKTVDVPDSVVSYSHIRADWDGLIKEVERDSNVVYKDKILEILRNGGEDRLEKLKEVNYSRPFWYMYHNIFPRIRACRVSYIVDLSSLIDDSELYEEIPDEPLSEPEDPFADLSVDTSLGITIQDPVPYGALAVKTNAVGWGMGLMNVAAEIDIMPHLSVSVPFYYSGGYNYFKSTIKFRGIVLQPQVRYYPWLQNGKNGGFYVDAHFGLGWYNFALNGDYRIQDHQGKTPAIGGGLGVGYMHHFKKNPRWGMEFSLGAGVYDVKYDMFYNEANGPYYEYGTHRTWIGLDNVSVGVFYKFDIRKGGKR